MNGDNHGGKAIWTCFFDWQGRRASPAHYDLSTDVCDLFKKKTSTRGTLPLSERKSSHLEASVKCSNDVSVRPYRLSGEFPKAYTIRDINHERRKERLWRDRKPPKQPSVYPTDTFPAEKLKLGRDAGAYETGRFKDVSVVSCVSGFFKHD